MKLHLGCGKRYIPGFVHVDLASFDHIDHQSSVDKLPFCEDDSVELIYACQILEYYDREELPSVLAEWRRVLKKGGTLRLSVPDFNTLTKLYQAGLPLDFFLGTLYGKWPISDNEYVYHKTIFDFDALKVIFEENGFENARLWNWRETEHADIDDFSQAYFPHMQKDKGILVNLNMEADKG